MIHRTTSREPGLARVRNVVASLVVSGPVSLELTAKTLGTSPRTLQRRLCGRGINFWTIVEQSRFEIATALLRGTHLSVQEIGSCVGYGTPGAFSRAFVKWAGVAPRAYRLAARQERQAGADDWREMGRPDATHQILSQESTKFRQEHRK